MLPLVSTPALLVLLLSLRILLGGAQPGRMGLRIGSILGLALVFFGLWLLFDPVLEVVRERTFEPARAARMMGGVFALFAGLSIRSGVKRQKVARERETRVASHETPWTIRESWREGRIDHETPVPRLELLMALIFGLGGGIAAATVVWSAVLTAEDPEWPALISLAFPAAGIFFVGLLRNALRKRARFGTSTLELETVPGWKGHHLAGTLIARIPPRDFPPHGLRIQLSAYRRTASRRQSSSGKGSSVQESYRLLHREEVHMGVARDRGDGLEIPVGFRLPEDVPSSTPLKRSLEQLARSGGHDIVWRIEVHGDLPGVDYDAEFEVPVFDLEEDTPEDGAPARPPAPGEDAPWKRHAIEPDRSNAGSRHLEVERPAPDRARVRVKPAGAGSSNFWVPLVLGVVFLVIAVLVFPQSFLGSLMLGGMGIFCLVGAWTSLTHETVISVEPGLLRIQTGRGGQKEKTHPLKELAAIEPRITGDQHRSDYTVVLLRKDPSGEAPDSPSAMVVRIASTAGGEAGNAVREGLADVRRHLARIDRIKDKHEADWIAEELREAARAQGVVVG